jgi:phosphatidylethanolamine/phosphatidyl-N-methylethanolamine N-methyltransferase
MDIDAIKKTYRRYAPRYNLYFGAVLHQGRKRVMEKMHCRTGDLVLEVGVGTGLSLPLYDPSVRVIGIDISPDMLKRARLLRERRKLNNVIRLDEMDAEQMSFPDDTFDKVVAMYVASVVSNPVRLVNEMRRVCKPDGEIFIVNHFHHTASVIGTFERLIAPLSKILGFHPDFPMDIFVSETGLEVIENSPVNLMGYWTLLRARNNKDSNGQYPDASESNRVFTGTGRTGETG